VHPTSGSSPPTVPGRFDTAADVVEAIQHERIGLLVIRKGGFSVGAAQGVEIIAHRTGSRYLQGRTAAGGWSQQRYARRRDNQADAGYALSGKAVEEVVLPLVSSLTRVVAGGDRAAVRTVLTQRGLEPVARLLSPAMLAVGPPKRTSLDELLAKARLIHIELTEPDE
jgi:peptide subunit release factor 1 (eRF1)